MYASNCSVRLTLHHRFVTIGEEPAEVQVEPLFKRNENMRQFFHGTGQDAFYERLNYSNIDPFAAMRSCTFQQGYSLKMLRYE